MWNCTECGRYIKHKQNTRSVVHEIIFYHELYIFNDFPTTNSHSPSRSSARRKLGAQILIIVSQAQRINPLLAMTNIIVKSQRTFKRKEEKKWDRWSNTRLANHAVPSRAKIVPCRENIPATGNTGLNVYRRSVQGRAGVLSAVNWQESAWIWKNINYTTLARFGGGNESPKRFCWLACPGEPLSTPGGLLIPASSCTHYSLAWKLVFPRRSSRPPASLPPLSLTYYPSTFCRARPPSFLLSFSSFFLSFLPHFTATGQRNGERVTSFVGTRRFPLSSTRVLPSSDFWLASSFDYD